MKIKTIIILLLLLIFIIILFQNLEVVSIQLLFWNFEMPRVILFPITLLLGVIIGFLLSSTRKKKKQLKDNSTEEN
ncbi:MAG: LapA family protein [Candidatus Cloacimonetes bacterium]|nr:LapA family protein [Candidatus Cloacimonadota bacterium]